MTKTEGIIIKGIGGFYYVKTAAGVLECRAKGIFRKRGISPLAGDRVVLEGESGGLVIADILPRKNAFARPAVANADNFFIVASAADPRPNMLVLDTVAAVARHRGLTPAIIVTKTDLGRAGELRRVYSGAGFRVIETRMGLRRGIREIRALCRGRLSVFAGNSGVGKSTLLNMLIPGISLETAEISRKLGRGRHTTRAVTLYDFEGGFIADTPGFSDLDIWRGAGIEKEELAGCFPEFAPYAGRCRFAGCSHTVEKGCAVLEALGRGKIDRGRHASYAALCAEAPGRKNRR
jgi:ribosome biogenesis GTPase